MEEKTTKKGKKLIVMIPCYNEEKTLPLVLNGIPESIDGIEEIKTLVIDDGCKDDTVKVAREKNVDYIVSHIGNKGLARAFATGLQYALELGADIIVNTDGDNQYPQEKISDLIKPIINGDADIVIGDRQTSKIKHFSIIKKFLQKIGSFVVRLASGTKVNDAVSGFRAYSREAALQLNITSKFSYCVETIIQAGKRKINVIDIPINTNPKTRESRLASSTTHHVSESAKTIIRTYVTYESLKTFTIVGLVFVLIGMVGIGRFIYFYLVIPAQAEGHIQSLVISGALLVVGFQVLLIGMLSDMVAVNRKLIEEAIYRIKKIGLKK